MKKIYVTPEVDVVLSHTEVILAGSGGAVLGDNSTGNGGGTEDGNIIKIGDEGVNPEEGGWARYDAWATWDDMGW